MARAINILTTRKVASLKEPGRHSDGGGLYKHVTTHGFRSTFRDWAGDCTSHPREVIEAALAHTIKNKAEKAYRRSTAIERRRGLMDEWAAYHS